MPFPALIFKHTNLYIIFKNRTQNPKMFSKMRNLFTATPQSDVPSMEEKFAHPPVGTADASQCPFMSKKGKEGENNPQKCPVGGKKADKTQADSDSEVEEKPQGGCPFMGASEKKKNPGLPLTNEAFDEPFVSKFKYYLSANKLDFNLLKKNGPHQLNRQLFDSYPVYLQHTLFYNGQDYMKVRNIECCSRFMAYEQLREKGNKYFNKGKYYQALDYYERAMSLFRWLEYYEENNDTKVSEHLTPRSERSLDQINENVLDDSKINIPLNGERVKEEENPFDELKDKYKEFFITYSDDNVKQMNGEDMEETADIDMRKSLLVQIYLNMAAAYINLNHFSLAERVIKDGLDLTEKVSQLYFRKAQTIAYRKDSNIEQLQQAKTCIEKALKMKPNEKIFSTANANILKMLNLHNAEQAYQNCSLKVQERLIETEARVKAATELIYNRAKEINEIEKRMIQEGKTPRENLDNKSLYDTTQMKILDRMLKKYCRVIEFYTQAKNSEQVGFAKKQFQQCLRVWNEVQVLFHVQLEEKDDELGGLQSEKIQSRVRYIKTRFAEDINNGGKFNFTMLEWVIKQIVKEQSAQQKRKQEEEARLNALSNPPKPVDKQGYSKYLYLLLLLPILLILANYFLL